MSANAMQSLLARLTPLKRIGATLSTSRSILLATSDPYLSCAAPLHEPNDTSDLGAVVVFCGKQTPTHASAFDDKGGDAMVEGELLSITVPEPSSMPSPKTLS